MKKIVFMSTLILCGVYIFGGNESSPSDGVPDPESDAEETSSQLKQCGLITIRGTSFYDPATGEFYSLEEAKQKFKGRTPKRLESKL